MTTEAEPGAAPSTSVAASPMSAPEAAPAGYAIRPATVSDLPTCAAIWRESINDYLRPLNLAEIPDDLGPILRLYGHLQTTDPATFVVAVRTGDDGTPAIDAFAVVVVRGPLRFLSMLFVLPGAQGRGLGRALLEAVLPDEGQSRDTSRATSTDSAQPISNGLYASLGIVPRIPLLRLVGLPERPDAFPDLPDGIGVLPFDEVEHGADGLGTAALAAELAGLDREIIGFAHPVDHAFVTAEGRRGFLYQDRTGAAAGYGYTSESGRVGPIAVSDPSLLGAVVGHLVTAVQPRGAFGLWVPGSADQAVVPLLRAGFRLDGFPVMLCWDRPFADFSRYLPISPGLL
jgi:GNAT superfamily N-acetyltransferase